MIAEATNVKPDTSKLKQFIDSIATEKATTLKVDPKHIYKGLREKIKNAGIPDYSIQRYLSGKSKPGVANANLILKVIMEYNPLATMEDLF